MKKATALHVNTYIQDMMERIPKHWAGFDTLLLASIPSFFEKLKSVPWLCLHDVYCVFTFEPLNIQHPLSSKLLKNYSENNFGSATLGSKEKWSVRGRKPFVSFEGSMLRACTPLAASNDKAFLVTGLRANLLTGEVSLQRNRRFSIDGLHSMVEWKGYRCIDIVFLFICAFLDPDFGETEDGEPSKETILYSSWFVKIYGRRSSGRGEFDDWMGLLRDLIKEWNERAICVFKEHFKTRLFRMRLYFSDPVCEDGKVWNHKNSRWLGV